MNLEQQLSDVTFLESVKTILDRSSWDVETLNYCKSKNVNKALNYLDDQQFSTNIIHKETNIFDVFELGEEFESSEIKTFDLFVAIRLANGLAQDRIAKFKWKIDESVIFKIK